MLAGELLPVTGAQVTAAALVSGLLLPESIDFVLIDQLVIQLPGLA